MAKSNVKEAVNDWKCEIIMKGIFKMIESAKLPGYDIIACLVTVMCNVIYFTCENRSQELLEKAAENVKQSVLDGLKEIEKLEKEEKNEQKQTNNN